MIKIDVSDPDTIRNISVDGFSPVIINVAPVSNIPMLIGSEKRKQQLAHYN